MHREEERRPVRGLEGREEVQDDLRQVLSGSRRVIAHVRSCTVANSGAGTAIAALDVPGQGTS